MNSLALWFRYFIHACNINLNPITIWNAISTFDHTNMYVKQQAVIFPYSAVSVGNLILLLQKVTGTHMQLKSYQLRMPYSREIRI